MTAVTQAIPYEQQSDPHASRTCGAACLAMVYRSLGREAPQTEIWPAISKPNRFGTISSTTHLMAQDAVNRGFQAVAIQARHPLQALRICRDLGLRAILNHRLHRDAGTGHYSVLVGIDRDSVVLHDPLLGPSRHLAHAELLELWLPYFANSEIAGNVLIAVASPETSPIEVCELCRTPVPSSVECPKCHKTVGLQPSAVLGCASNACIARMWNCLCCPACDCVWTFSVQSPGPGIVSAPQVTPKPPSRATGTVPNPHPPPNLDVDKLFGEVDKFSAHIQGIPAAANHPEVRRQLDLVTTGKERFKQALTDHLARSAKLQEQLGALAKSTEEQREIQRQKLEELNRPLPPLDGDALAQALLKNLGFIK